jgi:arabinose-5-phosphate isomerase
LEARGFSAQDFKTFHPGGSLGGRLKLVGDLMHTGDRLPLVPETEPMSTAIVTMSAKSFGCLGVIDGGGNLVGVITDGDLRRNMGSELLSAKATDVMTRGPKTIAAGTMAASALETMNASRISALFVVDGNRPVGILHIHDLLRVGAG